MGAKFNEEKGFKVSDKDEFKMVLDTLNKYNMPTNNFNNNLSSLAIRNISEEPNESMIVTEGSYDALNNTINYLGTFEDLIHELFHMSSNKIDSTRNMGMMFEKNGRRIGISINEGITDLFTSYTVKNYDFKYPIEALFVQLLSEVYSDSLFKYHFLEKPRAFYDCFKEDMQSMSQIIVKLDDFSSSIGGNVHMSREKFIDFCTSYLELMYKKGELIVKDHFDRFKSMFINGKGNIERIKSMFNVDINEMFDSIYENCLGSTRR